ncbi:Conserved_hypothetical protein [Hexamita inflata]|uniref:RIIa domain-containing protein n=1 Tax=Hexamita inflata TaxID=28002 RepID=A0ABP1HHD1_9EUKA
MNYVTKENQNAYFTDNELKEIRKEKVAAKIQDTDYLSAHPEIPAIIQDLYKQVLQSRPNHDELPLFVAKYFKQLHEDRCKALE